MTKSVTPRRRAPAPADPQLAAVVHGLAPFVPKPWRKSLTYQGLALIALAPWLAANAPGTLEAFHMNAADAAGLAKSVADVMAKAGLFLAAIGHERLRGRG